MLLLYLILALFAVMSIMAYVFFRRALYRPKTADPADEAAMQTSRWFAYGPIVTPGAKWLREQGACTRPQGQRGAGRSSHTLRPRKAP